MEVIGVVIFIWIAWAVIAGIIESHRQKVRDKIAHEVLGGINLQKEKEGVLGVNSAFNFLVDKNKCPNCGSALTSHRQMIYQQRKKVYGGYLRCNDYPRCKFQKQIYPISPWEKFITTIK